MDVSRRKFLGTSAAAVVAAGAMSQGKVFGANEKVRVCVIGCHGRGGSHLEGFTKSDGSEVVAICDPDERVLKARSRQMERETGKKVKTFVDMRDVFADDSIDAVSIATPNHWHTLASIWAMEAGKDVYVEKPATWSIWEGEQLIAAQKKYGRVLQHGTQRRSDARWLRDIALLQSGEIIGPLYMARGLGYKNGNRGSIGFKDNEEVPEWLDWRIWQGPASEQPYNPNYVHYTWHWFWDYGNGEVGNQGIHQLDIASWGMNRGMPVKVYANGGRYTYEDQAETPNTLAVTFTYEDGTMFTFDVRNRFTNDEAGVGVGNLFYADEGYYVEGKGFFDKENKQIDVDTKKYPYPRVKNCWQNFIDAVKAGDPAKVYGNAEDAHVSSALAHLANASYRTGRSLEYDPASRSFKDDEANALLKRDYHDEFTVPELA